MLPLNQNNAASSAKCNANDVLSSKCHHLLWRRSGFPCLSDQPGRCCCCSNMIRLSVSGNVSEMVLMTMERAIHLGKKREKSEHRSPRSTAQWKSAQWMDLMRHPSKNECSCNSYHHAFRTSNSVSSHFSVRGSIRKAFQQRCLLMSMRSCVVWRCCPHDIEQNPVQHAPGCCDTTQTLWSVAVTAVQKATQTADHALCPAAVWCASRGHCSGGDKGSACCHCHHQGRSNKQTQIPDHQQP